MIRKIILGISVFIISVIIGMIFAIITKQPTLIHALGQILIIVSTTIGILYLILYLWAKVYCRQHPEQWEEYKKQHPEKFKNKS